jgi:hypothetical protein
MSGGGKGGSTTSQVQIPAWMQEAAQENLARANDVSRIGYTPYFGPDVAALQPSQIAAMQNTNNAASAFGMAAPTDVMAGMPQAQQFAGGIQGYSSAPAFQQSVDTLAALRPGQYNAIQSLFVDPFTGGPVAGPQGFDWANSGRGRGVSTPTTYNAFREAQARGFVDGGNAAPVRAGTASAPRSGTGSFGLPDPMSGSFAGTNLPGIGGSIVNAITRR